MKRIATALTDQLLDMIDDEESRPYYTSCLISQLLPVADRVIQDAGIMGNVVTAKFSPEGWEFAYDPNLAGSDYAGTIYPPSSEPQTFRRSPA